MTRQLKSVLSLLFLLFALTSTPAFSQDGEDTEEAAAEEAGVTDYISMDPPFVTHVGGNGSKLIYLKATVSLRADSAAARPALEAHMPRLRHELVMLFGEQTDAEYLASMEGQQALAQEAKLRINSVLEEQQTGADIAGVLFTEFVVQK